MCGRYALSNPARFVALPLGLPEGGELPALEPRYNVAPSQRVPVLREGAAGREVAMLRWGLIPSWADDPSIGNRLANARGDTVAAKPSFRSAFRHRRGLMLADAFYEWQPTAGQKVKQPWCIRLADGAPFAIAALWERWVPRQSEGAASGDPIESCCLITTEPNATMQPIHDRMPVILSPEGYATWLDPNTSAAVLQTLLVPYPGPMKAHRVSTYVNSPRNEGAMCWEGIDV